ncbi:MAG: hypothetical protein AAFN78_02065 [Pseudomonadota bacterium]
MKRKLALWSLPCTLLLAATAHALPPTATPDYEIWISGASASDGFIGELLTELCVDGTLDTYFDDSSNPGRAQRAFFCTIDETQITGGLDVAQPDVLIHKRSAGGSALGVRPVCDKLTGGAGNEDPIDFLQIDTDCVFDNGTGAYLCPPDQLVQVHPDAGVSDVGPGEFTDGLQSSNCDVTNSSFGLVFGILANLRLRDALQSAQGLNVGSDAAADVPSLSTSQIRSILVGNVPTWDRLTFNGQGLNTYAQGLVSNTVNVCRRVPTSGTQTQSQLVLLGSGCIAGALGPAGAPGNPFTGPVVVENSGSGDVELCMQAVEDGGTVDNVGGSTTFQPGMAIGVQSTEKNGDEAFDYRHIRIDGVLPTINNAAKGLYQDWVVSTVQWKFPFVDDGNRDDIVAILDQIVRDAANPAAVASANTNADFVHDWGQGGALALAENGCSTDTTFDIGNPCTPYTRSPGGTPNNCTGPYLLDSESSPSRIEQLLKR